MIGSWPERTLDEHCRYLWSHPLTILLESSPTPHCGVMFVSGQRSTASRLEVGASPPLFCWADDGTGILESHAQPEMWASEFIAGYIFQNRYHYSWW